MICEKERKQVKKKPLVLYPMPIKTCVFNIVRKITLKLRCIVGYTMFILTFPDCTGRNTVFYMH